MDWALLARAVGMFAVTNIDDVVILALFFGQAAPSRSASVRVVIGQYLGFIAILAVSALGAFGATMLPPQAVPYLGFLPLALGLRAAWHLWRRRRAEPGADQPATPPRAGVAQVATVTFANGGDNIGVYVPVFAVAGTTDMVMYISRVPRRRGAVVCRRVVLRRQACSCRDPLALGTHHLAHRADRHRIRNPYRRQSF
ncbi:cadmium resistance transporter [Mycolicibacterium peregrinum]|uniref:cadmium resistance transporter n=1 Tax=Mycolicibacterium peregrinum TaxID=43304 RepID=UPI003AAE6CAC